MRGLFRTSITGPNLIARTDPSPVPRRLVKTPAAGHPLPWERAGKISARLRSTTAVGDRHYSFLRAFVRLVYQTSQRIHVLLDGGHHGVALLPRQRAALLVRHSLDLVLQVEGDGPVVVRGRH